MTESSLKLVVLITFLVIFLSLEIEGKKHKTKRCIGPGGMTYKNNQILNVNECFIKKCKKKKNVFRWKLKLKKNICCKYKDNIMSNGMEKEVDGNRVICNNGKIEIMSSHEKYNWDYFKKDLEENCHESHSVARVGLPLLAKMKELQNYVEDIKLEQKRILKENSTWVCGQHELRMLFKNERITETFSWLPWAQWFEEIFVGQTRSFGLPWQTFKQNFEDKFQQLNLTIDIETRIVGGKIVSPKYKYPFQVLVLNGGGRCGGSIITLRHVLTARHCFGDNPNYKQIFVMVGIHYLSEIYKFNGVSGVGAAYAVDKNSPIVRNENSAGIPIDNDIAILRLKVSIIKNIGNGKINIVLEKDMDTYNGKTATVSGWGLTSVPGVMSEELREVDLQVHTKCFSGPENDRICASSPGKDSCNGDSGGPLFVTKKTPIITHMGIHHFTTYRQIGIVSSGPVNCGTGRGVYVSVQKHYNWIKDITKTGNCDGSNANCCLNSKQCDAGEGGCTNNDQCKGSLVCRKHNNCKFDYTNCCEEEGDDDCFAPGSIVTIEDGSLKNIEELKIGDSVLAANGNFKPEFSKVLGWLHKDDMHPGFYLDLHTKNNSIKISPKHLIMKKGFHGEKTFVMAKYISRGDHIFLKSTTEDSFRWEPVQRILRHYTIGVYAPLTELGTIVVDNNVASCYAQISNHNMAHVVMAPIRLIPSMLDDEESQWKSGIRTYPRNLFRMAKILGLINHDETTDVQNKQKSRMNMEIMDILNIELLIFLNYFIFKK